MRLTLDDCKTMDFEVLMRQIYGVLDRYAAPEGRPETEEQLAARISLTLDELPDVYTWLRSLWSYFAHWTSGFEQIHGRNSDEYKDMIIRRDALEKAASAAKLRYDGTSRRLTQVLAAAEEAGLRHSR